MRLRPWLLWGAFGIVIGGLVLWVFAEVQHQRHVSGIFAKAGGDIKKAATLARAFELPVERCPALSGGKDDLLVARAIITVERFATSPTERLLEAWLVRVFSAVGLPLPNYSLGDGQIKPSTLQDALRFETNGRPPPNRAELARRLLDSCYSLKSARIVANYFARRFNRGEKTSARNGIIRVARAYNGQKRRQSIEGALSGAIYNELVYQLFQIYKFEQLAASK